MENFTYLAFISYKREDEKWAKWLQYRLEHYKLPTSVRKEKPSLPERVRPVFKDTTDLAGGVLEKKIKEALSSSKYLIVICSPRAAQSPWVCKEVQEFIDSGREEFIIPFIIDGEPNSKDISNECFPTNLRNLGGSRELLGININELGREAACIKVIARILGLHFDSLWQRYQRGKRSTLLSLFCILLLLILISIEVIITISGQRAAIKEKNDEINEQLITLREQHQTIEKKNAELEEKNAELKKMNHSLTLANITNEISLSEIEMQKGKSVYSFFSLYDLKEYKSYLRTDPDYCNLLLASYKSICTYPLVLEDVLFERMSTKNNRIDHQGDSIYLDGNTYVWMNDEEDLIISDNARIIDTLCRYSSTAVLTNDKRYVVYSDRDSVLYFYDTSKYTSCPVFKSSELYVWYFWGGGVNEVSYDNNLVLYESHSRVGNKSFIINLKEQKIIYDLFPLYQEKKSPDGNYSLVKKGSQLCIEEKKNATKIVLTDPGFSVNSSAWTYDNKINTPIGSWSSTWAIQESPLHVMSFASSSPIIDINVSHNNKYAAILTNHELFIFDLSTRRMVHKEPNLQLSYPDYCTFSCNNNKLACVDIYGMIYLYDLTNNVASYLGGYYDDEDMSNSGEWFQLSFILDDRYLALYNNVDYCYALFDLTDDNKEVLKQKRVVHLDDNYIYFENDSLLLKSDGSKRLWRKRNFESLDKKDRRMFPVRLKPVFDYDLGVYFLPKQHDRLSSNWEDLNYRCEVENESYSFARYNNDSTLFIIATPYDMHISKTNGILDELYFECLFKN